jgi:antitoxin component YwqK of YwqJK toxin-antitoxin module
MRFSKVWWLYAAVLLTVCAGILACISIDREKERVPCGDGSYKAWKPVMEGTAYFCQLLTKEAHGDYRLEDRHGKTIIIGAFDRGRAHSNWTWWYAGGLVIEQEGEYDLGLPTGQWKGNDENGTLRWEHYFHAGVGCGTWTTWDEQGEIESVVEYLPCDDTEGLPEPEGLTMAPDVELGWNGLWCEAGLHLVTYSINTGTRWCANSSSELTGPYGDWFPKDDTGDETKHIGGQHEAGLRTGTWTTWNQLGEVITQGDYLAGLQDGPWWWWRGDGMPQVSGPFTAGERSGKWTAWHSSGLQEWEGSYAADLEDGEWTWWWEDGVLKEQSEWKKGERDGSYKSYHRGGNQNEKGSYSGTKKSGTWQAWWLNGQKLSEGKYQHGWRQGLWKWWDSSGGPDMEGEYVDQNPVGEWTVWTTDVSLGLTLRGVGPYDFAIRSGIWTWTWEAAGTLESEMFYIGGLREGPWVSYWPDGVIRIEGQFMSGVGEHLWRYYYQSGELSVEESYHEGQRQGLSTTYWENGQLKAQGMYMKDRKSSTWTYWDEDGNITHTDEFSEWGNPQ